MRKLLLITAAIAMATPAFADYQHRRYPPPWQHQHHHQHRGINPWVAGAIGLGVLGVGTYYYNHRTCWNEPVIDRFGYQVYDQYGRPLVRRFCQ
jgi:multisubunit Na+/H+ antiporter MnhB subunit